MKYEVMEDCVLFVKKGSVILTDERQVRLAQRLLKEIKPKPKKKKEEE
jgi:hypothetical protein